MQTHSSRVPAFPENLQDYAPWVAKRGLVAPYGICQCGCGSPAPIMQVNKSSRGFVKGQPFQYISGHSRSGPLALRFWQKVNGGRPDDCWLWMGTVVGGGYGQLKAHGKGTPAHRVSWELHYGPIPAGLWVLHKCDNRLCVNPAHLFLGTALDNVNDMIAKGRRGYTGTAGTRRPSAKLDDDKVRAIRGRVAQGEKQCLLAKEYGVSYAALSEAANGHTWRHVDMAYIPPAERIGQIVRQVTT